MRGNCCIWGPARAAWPIHMSGNPTNHDFECKLGSSGIIACKNVAKRSEHWSPGPHSNLIFHQSPESANERTVNEKMSDQPLTMERAYRVLNIAPNASALTIKQEYRKLLKRWHPDLQHAGTTAHAESTEMSQRINEAYALIQHAPLRYERFASAKNTGPQPMQTESTAWQDFILRQAMRADANTPQRMDRLEFWVRFVCGAIFGCGVAFVLALDVHPRRGYAYPDAVIVPIFLLIVVALGYASARFGDRFWYGLLGLKEPRL